jgi:hypothetical protein
MRPPGAWVATKKTFCLAMKAVCSGRRASKSLAMMGLVV